MPLIPWDKFSEEEIHEILTLFYELQNMEFINVLSGMKEKVFM